MQEICGENYRVMYDSATAKITCEGTFRLYGAAGYLSLSDFQDRLKNPPLPKKSEAFEKDVSLAAILNQVLETPPPIITLDLRGVEYLNSAGINVISKFVINIREQHSSRLVIQGTRRIPWQQKILPNFQRLLSDVCLEIE